MLAYSAADFAISDPTRAPNAQCLAVLRPPVDFYTDDIDRLFAGFGECLQLTAGTFQGKGMRVHVPGMRITGLNFNCGVQIRRTVDADRLHLVGVCPAPGSRVLADAVDCTSQTCIVVSGDELSVNILGAASLLWFDIDRRVLAPPGDTFSAVRAVLELNGLERAMLVNYANNRTDEVRTGARAYDPFETGPIDQAIASLAGSLLDRAKAHVETRADASRERLVRKAQELMWASIEEPPTLREICKAAKCSVRTLIYAFNASFGMSPMKYFKIQRLNAAHRKFQNSPAGTHIFDVAADCGFWHLGHFGVDYKMLFGSTPKTTHNHCKSGDVDGACERKRSCAGLWCV